MSESPIRLIGEPALLKKLDAGVGAPAAVRFLFDTWRYDIERSWTAKVVRGPGGWLWKGEGRRSITSEIDKSRLPRWARVGSNLISMRWGEYGTGLLSEDPESKHRRYFPPPKALDEWAIQHGFRTAGLKRARADVAASPGTYGFLIARMIWAQGGLKPRRFLRKSVEEADKKMPEWLAAAAKIIEVEAPRAH